VHLLPATLPGVNSKWKAQGRGGARLKLGAWELVSHVLALQPPRARGGVENGGGQIRATIGLTQAPSSPPLGLLKGSVGNCSSSIFVLLK
jgi:hypothetical protein